MNGLTRAMASVRTGLTRNLRPAQYARFLADKPLSGEEEGAIAQQQFRSQQTVSPKMDDDTLSEFEAPWRGKIRDEDAYDDLASEKLDKGAEGAGEVLQGAAQAMAKGVPLHKEVVTVDIE